MAFRVTAEAASASVVTVLAAVLACILPSVAAPRLLCQQHASKLHTSKPHMPLSCCVQGAQQQKRPRRDLRDIERLRALAAAKDRQQQEQEQQGQEEQQQQEGSEAAQG